MANIILGVDIGGTGMKAAPVDVETGKLVAKRHRIATPKPATPKAIARVLNELQNHFGLDSIIGCGFPAVVKDGWVSTANNIDKSWIGVNARELFERETGSSVNIINDADAAGLAEATFGAAKNRKGLVILLTIGTGIGTGMLFNGKLIPNTELGSILYKGDLAEKHVSGLARKQHNLSWEKWAKRFNEYLHFLETFLQPELIVLGGGVSTKYHRFAHLIDPQAEVLSARFCNRAGIIGAAVAAAEKVQP